MAAGSRRVSVRVQRAVPLRRPDWCSRGVRALLVRQAVAAIVGVALVAIACFVYTEPAGPVFMESAAEKALKYGPTLPAVCLPVSVSLSTCKRVRHVRLPGVSRVMVKDSTGRAATNGSAVERCMDVGVRAGALKGFLASCSVFLERAV